MDSCLFEEKLFEVNDTHSLKILNRHADSSPITVTLPTKPLHQVFFFIFIEIRLFPVSGQRLPQRKGKYTTASATATK